MAMAAGLWGSSTNLFIAATMGHCSVELEKNRSQSCKIASRPKMDFKSSLLAVRAACFDKWLQFQLILFQAKYLCRLSISEYYFHATLAFEARA